MSLLWLKGFSSKRQWFVLSFRQSTIFSIFRIHVLHHYFSGTFIDISLLSNDKRVQTKRTEMKTRKTEIFFYERFSFLVGQETADKCSLRCRAVHKVGSLIKRDHVIGQVVIGSEGYCSGDGLRHWKDVMGRPKKNITQWHFLKEGWTLSTTRGWITSVLNPNVNAPPSMDDVRFHLSPFVLEILRFVWSYKLSYFTLHEKKNHEFWNWSKYITHVLKTSHVVCCGT